MVSTAVYQGLTRFAKELSHESSVTVKDEEIISKTFLFTYTSSTRLEEIKNELSEIYGIMERRKVSDSKLAHLSFISLKATRVIDKELIRREDLF